MAGDWQAIDVPALTINCTDCRDDVSKDKNCVKFRDHCLSAHLPWYFQATSRDTHTTELSMKVRPAFGEYLRSGTQMPCFYFKYFGSLMNGFLTTLASYHGHSDSKDLLLWIQKKERHICEVFKNTFSDKNDSFLMTSHQLYMTGQSVSPKGGLFRSLKPMSTSEILYWPVIMYLIWALPIKLQRRLQNLEITTCPITSIEPKSTNKDATLRAICNAIRDQKLNSVWKLFCEHKEFFKRNNYFLQIALHRNTPKSARLLLNFGADPSLPIGENVYPLTRALAGNNLDIVEMLLPWLPDNHIEDAIKTSGTKNHKVREMASHLKQIRVIRSLEVRNLNEDDCFIVPEPNMASHVVNKSNAEDTKQTEETSSKQPIAIKATQRCDFTTVINQPSAVKAENIDTKETEETSSKQPFAINTSQGGDFSRFIKQPLTVKTENIDENRNQLLGSKRDCNPNTHASMSHSTATTTEGSYVQNRPPDDVTKITCSLCRQFVSCDVSSPEFRRHCLSEHLPWFFSVSAHGQHESVLCMKLRPALNTRWPFVYYAQVWASLLTNYLEHLKVACKYSTVEELHERATMSSEFGVLGEALILPEDQRLIQCHRYFKNTGQISKLLQWNNVMRIIFCEALPQPQVADLTRVEIFHIPSLDVRPDQDLGGLEAAIMREDLQYLWNTLQHNTVYNAQSGLTRWLIFALRAHKFDVARFLLFCGANANVIEPGTQLPIFNHADSLQLLLPWLPIGKIQHLFHPTEYRHFQNLRSLIKAHLKKRELLNMAKNNLKRQKAKHFSGSPGVNQIAGQKRPSGSGPPDYPASKRHKPNTSVKGQVAPPTATNNGNVCPICLSLFPDAQNLKEHVCGQHLPWYVSIELSARGITQQTTLSSQLLPVLTPGLEQSAQYHPDFSMALGRLLNGLLNHVADLLNLKQPEDIVGYRKTQKLFTRTLEPLRRDEEFTLQAVHVYRREARLWVKDARDLSAPECVTSTLHWRALAAIVAKLPQDERDKLLTYEMYTSRDVLGYQARNTTVPDKAKETLCDALTSDDVILTQRQLSAYPTLSDARFEELNGSTCLELAVMSRNFTIATLLLLYGANVDLKNESGFTAFMVAAKENTVEGVEFLIRWGPTQQIQQSYDVAKALRFDRVAGVIAEAFSHVEAKSAGEKNTVTKTSVLLPGR